jgi:hypothetical protein
MRLRQFTMIAGVQFALLVTPLKSINAYERTEVAFSGGLTGFQSRLLMPIHEDEVLLGCVYSTHSCSDLAHEQGYYYHRAVHDHATCHHGPSYACYAW